MGRSEEEWFGMKFHLPQGPMNLKDVTSLGADLASMASLTVALVGLFGATSVAVRRATPLAKPVSSLWQQLKKHAEPSLLKAPIIEFQTNPYHFARKSHALIVQGRNKEGKTTLLARAIPWFRRRGPSAWKGIVFDGAKAGEFDSFATWHSAQMFGRATKDLATDLEAILQAYRERQWVRVFLGGFIESLAPDPAYVIIDQFEELLKKHPSQALAWANNLTNSQTRNGLARVFFIVHSNHATQSLLNLDQGKRFDVLRLAPVSLDDAETISGLDAARFKECERNIGMYKYTQQVPLNKLKHVVHNTSKSWDKRYNLPYPAQPHDSWDALSDEEFRDVFLAALRRSLEKLGHAGVEDHLNFLRDAMRLSTFDDVKDLHRNEWTKVLLKRGVRDLDAKAVANHIMRTLALEVPPFEQVREQVVDSCDLWKIEEDPECEISADVIVGDNGAETSRAYFNPSCYQN